MDTTPKKRPTIAIIIGGVIVLLLLAVGILPRLGRNKSANALAKDETERVPVVLTARASTTTAASELLLPGNIEAVNVAALYARTSGYVRKRFVDIGSPVKAGQLLAVIDSPEIDQELASARATLAQVKASLLQAKANLQQAQAGINQATAAVAQARANEEIAATTHQRWDKLVNKGVLPKQAGDERRSAYAARQAEGEAAQANLKTAEANTVARQADITAAEANVQAATANVRRLEEMQQFERVVAPFAGVITERNVEQGNLVAAGNGGERPLFSIAQPRTLRIQVNIPQTFAVDLKQGQQAELIVRERAGEKFLGTVARTASALNQGSRTLLAEVQIDNRNGSLLPGMYADVKFSLPRGRKAVMIPADALQVDGKGTRIAVLRGKNVHFAQVQVGRDFGEQVEILSGLNGDEQVVRNPPDTLGEGRPVEIQQQNAQAKGESK